VIAALYVAAGGCYTDLPGVDAWTEDRDARLYDGPWPVVAHPPCARWSVLAYSVRARYGYEIGDDGGCFAHALSCIRKFGGVLEHPARSIAFGRFQLGRPAPHHWQRNLWGDWVTQASQTAYGHKAQKRTWLVFHSPTGRQPPELDWREYEATHQVSYGKRDDGTYWLPPLSKVQSKATPIPFRDLLISMARSARV